MNFLKIFCIINVFLTITNKLAACAANVASAEDFTFAVPHHKITVSRKVFSELQNKKLQEKSMSELLTSFKNITDIPNDIIGLLADCQVRPGGVITTQNGTIYFCRRLQAQSSHWIIKQFPLNHVGERCELKVILELLRSSNYNGLSRNSLLFAMPECTFSVHDESENVINFTLYHRVDGQPLYECCSLGSAYGIKIAQKLGSQLFKLHQAFKPTQQELKALSTQGKINVIRYYGAAQDKDFEKTEIEEELLQLDSDSKYLSLLLTRCMGDLHHKNLISKKFGQLVLIDYATLARDTRERNQCSSFVNDVSYYLFCVMHFYGHNFADTGFLSNFLASYLKAVHPEYNRYMLAAIKKGFIFFVEQLTHDFCEDDFTEFSSAANRTGKINDIIDWLNAIMRNSHGLNEKSSNKEILAAITKFQTLRNALKTKFIDEILEGSRAILARLPWKQAQEQALSKVIARRKMRETLTYKFSEPLEEFLSRLSQSSIDRAIKTDILGNPLPFELINILFGTHIEGITCDEWGISHYRLSRQNANQPKTAAVISGPYQQDVIFSKRINTLAQRVRLARRKNTTIPELVIPHILNFTDGAYLVYPGHLVTEAVHHQPNSRYEYCQMLKDFGTQLFNWHQATTPKLNLTSAQRTLGLIDTETAKYLLVNPLGITDHSVRLRKHRKALIYTTLLEDLASPAKFTVDVYSFIRSIFANYPYQDAALYAGHFLDGYMRTVPNAIARGHMLPDLKIEFIRDVIASNRNTMPSKNSVEQATYIFFQMLTHTRFRV
jgi:hypothetical protein